MNKLLTLLTIGLALSPRWQVPSDSLESCIATCRAQHPNIELQREEITNLEREAAHGIQLNNTTFFDRVYSDDYSGTLSHGQIVNKAQFVQIVRNSSVKYESILPSHIQVRFYRDTAVANCLWSARIVMGGERVGAQLRVTTVYVNTPGGWRVITSQTTALPPDLHLPI